MAKLTRCGRNRLRVAAGSRSTAPATAALAIPPRVVKARIDAKTLKFFYFFYISRRPQIVARRIRLAGALRAR